MLKCSVLTGWPMLIALCQAILSLVNDNINNVSLEFCEQYWTSPGGNTPQGTNYTVTCLPSRKLYKLDEPDMQVTAGEARTNSSVMYSYGPPHMAKQKQDDQLEHAYSSYVGIRDVALKTCRRRWTLGRSGEKGSGISVLAARHDDDDDDFSLSIALKRYPWPKHRWENSKSNGFKVIELDHC